WRVLRTPCPLQASDTAKIKSQESEALAPFQVDDSALLFIDLDVQFGKFLAQSLLHRLHQPVMLRMSVNQDHQIVSETRIFDEGVLAAASVLFSPLQHSVHLI